MVSLQSPSSVEYIINTIQNEEEIGASLNIYLNFEHDLFQSHKTYLV